MKFASSFTVKSRRSEVIQLYKELLYMGRDYPLGYPYFRDRCKKAFAKNAQISDADHIEQALKRGRFVVEEIKALYFLKKYRTMKQRYYEPPREVYRGQTEWSAQLRKDFQT